MAEVTSNSTAPTQCSPPNGETDDDFKSVGSLTFRINDFREFSNSPPTDNLTCTPLDCDTEVRVRGLTFWLAVDSVRCVPKKGSTEDCMCMKVYLECENDSGCNVEDLLVSNITGDDSWSCLASVTMRIKSLFGLRADEIYEFTHRFFSSKEKSSLEWEDEPWSFDFLMNPRKGLYNKKDDTLELIVEILVDAPVGLMELPKMDIIQVNEETLAINKIQLAMHSRYFYNMFYNAQFREGQSGEYKVQIEEPARVYHFKRMMATLYPENKPLDDHCIEGVLHLANRFLVTVVEGKCLEFLMEKSKKTALFKYRLADKYGCTALKKHVLHNLKVTDFKGELYKANIAEHNKLGPSAAKAYMARYDELFSSSKSKRFQPYPSLQFR